MSSRRNPMPFHSRSPFSGHPKVLTFADSDEEDSELYAGIKSGPGHDITPPRHLNISSGLWDSGLCSPTPGSSPKTSAQRKLQTVLSPIPFPSDQYDSDGGGDAWMTDVEAHAPAPDTPPHRRMRSLRLYDTPHTPKSLLQKAQRRYCRASRSKPSPSPAIATPETSVQRHGPCKHALDPHGPQANVNPFTSISSSVGLADKSLKGSGIKRGRHDLDGSTGEDSPLDDAEDDRPYKKLALREINTSRYMEEFHQVAKIGDGEFGSVYECVNRLDGCTYAVKKSKTPVAGSAYERNALNEVYAHAVLGKHQHVVRYYSAWAEDDHMYIQNEYCNGGSLADVIVEHRATGERFGESDLAQVLMQVAQGLKYIHAQNLVHLDIKPANVFIHQEPHSNSSESGMEDDVMDDDVLARPPMITYKIGDLGHVTSVTSPVVEEGDCRYLPTEILQEQYSDLPKADVFSLALTVYEAGSTTEMPKNGPLWHRIREEGLPDLPLISADFNRLLKLMADMDPKKRPSASALAHHPILCPFQRKSRAQLYRELNAEKLKNQLLSRELVQVRTSAQQQPGAGGRGIRLLGRNCSRSISLTAL